MRRARALANEAGELFVPQVVQVELVWVLTGAYRLRRSKVVEILEHLDGNQAFVLQAEERFTEALDLYRNGSAGFADYVVLAEARAAGVGLASFDGKLARTEGVISA